jgi:hypothetical protein
MSSTNAGASSPGAAEFALLAGVSLAWGTSYMFTKIAVGAIPPVTLIALESPGSPGAMSPRWRWSG